MKKLFLLLFGLLFVINTTFAFQENSDSMRQHPSPSWIEHVVIDTFPPTNSVTHNVTFEPATVNATVEVREQTTTLEQCFKRQGDINEALIHELSKLNDKIPDMSTSVSEAKFQELEENFNISKEDALNSIHRQTVLTSSVNFLIFILTLGVVGFLLTNNKVKREPDIILKTFHSIVAIGALFLLRYALLSFVTLVNPTYQIIQQLTFG